MVLDAPTDSVDAAELNGLYEEDGYEEAEQAERTDSETENELLGGIGRGVGARPAGRQPMNRVLCKHGHSRHEFRE